MTKAEMLKILIDWCNRAYQIEKTLEDFNLQHHYLFAALNKSQVARMYAGDLVRLVVLQDSHRVPNIRFVPKEHNCHVKTAFSLKGHVDLKESTLLLKDHLRRLYYETVDAIGAFDLTKDSDFNVMEFHDYWTGLRHALKETDQQLGLLLGALSYFSSSSKTA